MQREIKFRAKGQTDGKWRYGLLVHITNAVCHIKDKRVTWICDAETLGQHTGLKDKNGKEIYEGDIVEYKDFSNGMYLFKEQPKARGVIKIDNLLIGIYLKGMGTFEESKVEIIGNIHDNPELLEVNHETI